MLVRYGGIIHEIHKIPASVHALCADKLNDVNMVQQETEGNVQTLWYSDY